MTVTVERPKTRCRGRGKTYQPTAADVHRAAWVADELDAGRPVTVRLAGAGGGWYVIGVDAERFTYDLLRDRVAVEVPWGEVTE